MQAQAPYIDSPRYSPFEKANLEDSIDAEKLLEEFSEIFAGTPKLDAEPSLDIKAHLIDSGEKAKNSNNLKDLKSEES